MIKFLNRNNFVKKFCLSGHCRIFLSYFVLCHVLVQAILAKVSRSSAQRTHVQRSFPPGTALEARSFCYVFIIFLDIENRSADPGRPARYYYLMYGPQKC